MLRGFFSDRYRNLRMSDEKKPEFGRINLLVGPNNSGKSNFIRAMGFLRDLFLAEDHPTKLLHTIDQHGRAESLNRAVRDRQPSTQFSPHMTIDLAWLLDGVPKRGPFKHGGDGAPASGVPSSTLVYEVGYRVGPSQDFPSGFSLEYENIMRFAGRHHWPPQDEPLFRVFCEESILEPGAVFELLKSGEKQRVHIFVTASETVFAQKEVLLQNRTFYETMFPEFMRLEDELLAFARGFHSYASTDLDVRQLAEGAKIDLSVRALDAEGSQFVNVLRYLDQKYDFLDEYAERLRELCPDLRKLKVIDASDTYKQLELNIGGHKYKPREMSDGTLKAMWLALLLFSPEKGSVLSIDEPEMNLHPAWLKVIGRWLQRFSSAEQLFVSTHSPDLLDTFTEGFKTGEVALFVFGLGDKEMRRVEPGELESFWKDGWELGDLYRVGEPKLGGWPW